jgi:hypothetical protein
MHYNDDDMAIVQAMDEQGNNQYQRYLQNRFVVDEIFPKDDMLCANIIDKESGAAIHVHAGDKLADGKIAEITDEGVIFAPPRADVQKFVLPHAREMMPVGAEKHSRFRDQMNDMFSREAQSVPKEDSVMIMIMEDSPVIR